MCLIRIDSLIENGNLTREVSSPNEKVKKPGSKQSKNWNMILEKLELRMDLSDLSPITCSSRYEKAKACFSTLPRLGSY